jgi:hypothetical protein
MLEPAEEGRDEELHRNHGAESTPIAGRGFRHYAIPATCINARRPSRLPRTASRRRWASVSRSGRTTLLAEDPILLSKIVDQIDQILLVAIHPASNGEHEELQRIGHRERLLARDGQHQIRRRRFAGPRPTFRTLRGPPPDPRIPLGSVTRRAAAPGGDDRCALRSAGRAVRPDSSAAPIRRRPIDSPDLWHRIASARARHTSRMPPITTTTSSSSTCRRRLGEGEFHFERTEARDQRPPHVLSVPSARDTLSA